MKIVVYYDLIEHLHFRMLEQTGLQTPVLDVTETWLKTMLKKTTDAGTLDVLDDSDLSRVVQLLTEKGVVPTQGLFRVDVAITKITVVEGG